MNEGRLVKLSGDAASVFIANPAIADVAIKSPRLVYIFGKRPGEDLYDLADDPDAFQQPANLRALASRSGEKCGLARKFHRGVERGCSSCHNGLAINELHHERRQPLGNTVYAGTA